MGDLQQVAHFEFLMLIGVDPYRLGLKFMHYWAMGASGVEWCKLHLPKTLSGMWFAGM